MSILVAAFYRFLPLPNYQELRGPLLDMGEERGLRGTILLAEEGLNSTLAGKPEEVRAFLLELEALIGAPLETKFSQCDALPFRRWRVKLKREIVTMKAPEAEPLRQVGEYVEAEDWNEVLSDPATKVIDVRNRFEIDYGSFEGAEDPLTDDFSDFPRYVAENLPDKDQPIAMFCTGGIRCEKATSYLLAHGYRSVKHLRGGILKYLEVVPESESQWHGSCFVFDEREALTHDLSPIPKEAKKR